MCAPLNGLKQLHSRYAQLKLASFDVVLLLGADELNDRCGRVVGGGRPVCRDGGAGACSVGSVGVWGWCLENAGCAQPVGLVPTAGGNAS